MYSPSNIRRSCDECDSSSVCDESSEDKRICPKSKGRAYLLQKSPDSPLMVYERAALFLEQFEENRKKRMQDIKKFDSDLIPEPGGKNTWSSKCSHCNHDFCRQISPKSSSNFGFGKGPKAIEPPPKRNQKQDNPTKCKCSLGCERDLYHIEPTPDNDDDSIDRIIESAIAINKKLSGDMKRDDPGITLIVFFSMLWVMFLGTISDNIHAVLSYIKQKLASYIVKFWNHWNMITLLQKKECSKTTLFLFSPVIAVIGAFYSCVWIAYVVSKALRRPVPHRYVKRINLKRLFEDRFDSPS